jgi:uracil-DNA glycosylase
MPPEVPFNIARLLRQQAESWQAAGATHLPLAASAVGLVEGVPAPVGDTSVSAPVAANPATLNPNSMKSQPTPRPASRKPQLFEPDPAAAPPAPASPPSPPLSGRERTLRLQVLAETVSRCTRCPELASTRTQTVFGVGIVEARILFIGEAPGADEDAQGEPFVGKAGQLLNRIIAACRLKREELYICNILKCRPPGNRPPERDECANCHEYLEAQVATVDPEYIVCWGTVAAQNLLKTDIPIGKLRKQFFRYGRAKVVCTYHPSYLLRNPPAKKDVWEDMKFFFADLGIDLEQKQ